MEALISTPGDMSGQPAASRRTSEGNYSTSPLPELARLGFSRDARAAASFLAAAKRMASTTTRRESET